jgi:hypothetical protein
MVPDLNAAAGGCFLHTAERFMPDHQPALARRRRAKRAGDDFAVCSANAEHERAHQHCAVGRRRVGHVFKLR